MSQGIKPMNTKELAALYEVSDYVFTTWLELIKEKLGPKVGRTWTIKQIEIMYEHFGTPGNGTS